MTQKELEQKVIDAESRVAKREAVLKKHNSQLTKMIEKGADRFDISIKREDIKSATSKLAEARETLTNWQDNAGLPFCERLADGGDNELSPYVYDGSMTLADREKMQQAREAFEKLADALREIAAKLAEALKPVINAVLSALKKLWKVSAKAIGMPPKWLHLAAHAKKARTRKKYRNRIRRYVFEALAAEGGGGP